MSIKTHYLTETEREQVADALYHEGLGYLHRQAFVANVPDLVGSPGEASRVYDVVESVLDGTYRGDMVQCSQVGCYCHN